MLLFDKCFSWERERIPFALVTLTATCGTVSRREGRMAVSLYGERIGTIGGGKGESEAVSLALSAIKEGRGGKHKIKIRDKGEIEIMIDLPQKDRSVIIIGAGHVSRALCSLFSALSWRVTVLDSRRELLNEETFPSCNRVVTENILSSLKELDLNSNCALLSTIPEENTRLLPYLIESDVFYIGLLSSKKRIWSEDSRVHSPMGLELGEETPEEIALSVASEVMKVFFKKSGRPHSEWRRRLVVVRGAGDLATGTIIRLTRSGYSCIALETEKPTVIRRTVSFADVVYEGTKNVEGVECRLASSISDALEILKGGAVPLLIDSTGKTIEALKPGIVVDAIIAKKNCGTTIKMAPLVIALGPGFEAGKDAHVVIETMRGHNLGRIIEKGCALPNTGVPGIVGGKGKERVIHSPVSGVFEGKREIGDIVNEGDTIAEIDGTPVITSLSGRLRGLLHSGIWVPENFKVADVDPRGEETDHTTVSDKARAIGGAVLEAADAFLFRKGY